ncbi:hypothetical protein KAJ38_00850 [Candidatus Pacearchaeota archaeon]|nr:hypothetical protein [Candidatus Pacearchaeota archaeon]
MKKDAGQIPPDVGKEDEFEEENAESGDSGEEVVRAPDKLAGEEVSSVGVPSEGDAMAVNSASELEMEKIKGRIESVVEWINQFYERFSYVSESIGELRAMNVENEKKIMGATKEAEKVVDIVKEVKPAELRLDYQKIDMRMQAFEEKVAGNRQFMEELMNVVGDLKRNSEIFVGTESLMKLNEDTKKDLVEMQKINARTKMHADKSQEIFMELKTGFADSQKLAAIVDNLEGSYSGLREEIERVKLNHETVINQASFADFKKTFGNKIAILDSVLAQLDGMKNSEDNLGRAIESSLSIARRNEDDIGNVAMKIGNKDVKGVTDYENQVIELLGIVDTLTTQVAELRKKAGIKNVVSSKKKAVVPVVAVSKMKKVVKKKTPVLKDVNVGAIVDYIKKNKPSYSIPDIKKEILSKGYSEGEFSEALNLVSPKEKAVN